MNLDDLLDQTKDADHYTRNTAAFNLYLRARNAERLLADYKESDARRRNRAEQAVIDLGRLLHSIPSGRKTVPLDAVRDIWRAACHG